MNIINNQFFKRVYQKIFGLPYSISYAQTGEDIIIEFLIGAKKIKNFTYLDIGANNPVKITPIKNAMERLNADICVSLFFNKSAN